MNFLCKMIGLSNEYDGEKSLGYLEIHFSFHTISVYECKCEF